MQEIFRNKKADDNAIEDARNVFCLKKKWSKPGNKQGL